MLRKLRSFGLISSAFCLLAPMAGAQDTSSAPQLPIVLPGPRDLTNASPTVAQEDVVADTLPLAGAQNLTLGMPANGHGFLLPSFGVVTTVQTNPFYAGRTNRSGAVDVTYLTGRLAMNRSSGHSNLSLDYLAGGAFSSDPVVGKSGIQGLHFADSIDWGRWSVMFGDQLSYTSQSPFGFGGLGGTNNLGVGLGNAAGSNPQFRNGFLPSQSVFLYGAPQLGNAAIGEVDYAFSHRSSLTLAAAYDKLHFLNGNFLDSQGATFQGGYSYLLDRFNSIAVLYRYNRINAGNLTQSLQVHSAELSYARRVTGRLSFQVSAGPDVLEYAGALAGSKSVASWMADASLQYRRERFTTGLNYDHLVTGGSGVLLGAATDVLSASIGQPIYRRWDGTITTGYARNRALRQTTANAAGIVPQAWFTTVQITKHFVGYGSLYFSYGASGQDGLGAICTQPGCRAGSLNHTIAIGYNWGLRPVVLE